MKFVVGRADEIPPGSRKIVRVEGRSIGVFNVDGTYYAIRNRCPHQGAPLCEGKLWGTLTSDVPGKFEYSGTKEIIACISHGWEFSLKTGQSWCDPRKLRVKSYQVSVENPEAIGAETPVAPPDRVRNPTLKDLLARQIAPAPESAPTDDPEAPAPGMVKGPYAVETYPVSIEDGYLYLVVDVTDIAVRASRRTGHATM